MKADGSLRSLLQGVSQQPTRDRLPGQCTEMINMSADPVKGLSRRPGDDMLGFMGPEIATGFGTFQTQDSRKFLAKIYNGGIRIFDYNCQEYPVVYSGDNTAYLSTQGTWSFATVKNKTYVANSAIMTAMSPNTNTYANGPSDTAIIQVLGGQYGKSYRIILDAVEVATFQTVDGSNPQDANYVGTTFIAQTLYYLLTHTYAGSSTPPAPIYHGQFFKGTNLVAAGWSVDIVNDLILLKDPLGANHVYSVNDDYNNVNFKVNTQVVSDEADLPKSAPHNFAVRVAKQTNPDEDLWLRFVSDVTTVSGAAFGQSGAWYECLAPGYSTGFVNETMPRVITFDGTTFTFSVEDWADRTVGTEETNPSPSFIGRGINDMAIFQSRLVLVAGNSVVMSRSKKYTNMFVGSASTIADSDPIDITSQAAFSSILRYVIPHNKDLVIFSSQGQFIVFGRTTATPKNAALVLTTSFEADVTARPSPNGRNVYFSTKFGKFTGIREFYTEGGTDINDTRPTTAHVKEYLLGNVFHISSTSNYDTLLVHTKRQLLNDNFNSTVYVYQFLWADNSKVQSAWSKWVFQDTVAYSFFDQEDIYLVVATYPTPSDPEAGYYLQRLSLDVTDEDDLDYHIHLSCKFDVNGLNTQFELPAYPAYHNIDNLICVQGNGCPNPGLPVRVQSIDYNSGSGKWVVTLKQDMNGGHIIGGIKYQSEYWPTIPRMTDASGDVINNARLIPNQFTASLEQTGHIAGQKMTKWGNAEPVEFEGYIASAVSSVVGRPALDDFDFNLPFKEKVQNAEIRFYTDKHWPMTLLDISWEGTVNKRGRRLSIGQKGANNG